MHTTPLYFNTRTVKSRKPGAKSTGGPPDITRSGVSTFAPDDSSSLTILSNFPRTAPMSGVVPSWVTFTGKQPIGHHRNSPCTQSGQVSLPLKWCQA